MDDHTRDEVPGTGQNLDVPLKRDRKLLRSSKPLPSRDVQPEPTVPVPLAPEQLREPEAPDHGESALSPAEQLFADSRPRFEPDDVDYVHDQETAAEPQKKKGLFGLSFTRKPRAEAPSEAGVHGDEAPDVEVPDPEGAADYFATSRLPVQQPPTEVFDSPVHTAGYPPRTADSYAAGNYEPVASSAGRAEAHGGPAHPKLGPLEPTPAVRHSGLAGLDIAALVAAILLPPIGLVVAIVAIIRGKQVRGWASDLARAAISVALVMTVVFTAGGGFVWASETARAEELAQVRAEQRAHDRVEAVSAPFCGVLEANPTIYATADPDYGWPALDASPSYLSAIVAYSKVWAQIAEASPAGIAEETAAISQRVAGVVNIATALGSSNRAGDLLGLHEKDDLATVESWYVEYCSIPE